MTEEVKAQESVRNVFETMWAEDAVKGIDRNFHDMDYSTKLSVTVTDQDYLVTGEGKQEVVKAATVAEALAKSQIKSVTKVEAVIGQKKTVLSSADLSKSESK